MHTLNTCKKLFVAYSFLDISKISVLRMENKEDLVLPSPINGLWAFLSSVTPNSNLQSSPPAHGIIKLDKEQNPPQQIIHAPPILQDQEFGPTDPSQRGNGGRRSNQTTNSNECEFERSDEERKPWIWRKHNTATGIIHTFPGMDSPSDSSDWDKELDNLLQSTSDAQVKKPEPEVRDPPPLPGPPKEKDETEGDIAVPVPIKKAQIGIGSVKQAPSAKSVRFQDDLDDEPEFFKKPNPSNLLNSMFFAAEGNNDGEKKSANNGTKSASLSSRTSGKKADNTDDDWLGIGKGGSTKSKEASKQEKDDFMMDFAFDLPFEDAGTKKGSKGSLGSTVGGREPKDQAQPRSFNLSEFGLSSTPSSPRRNPPFSSLQEPASVVHNKPPPIPAVNPSPEPRTKSGGSILDALPFLRESSKTSNQDIANANKTSHNQGSTESVVIRDTPSPSPAHVQEKLKKTVKSVKKTSGVSISSPSSLGTLQLPSHLVNEDELRSMSTSLKVLYAHQLELQEQSYKEQIEFLTLQGQRKEERLKDELSRLQETYDLRIEKLNEEISKVSPGDLKDISSKLEKVTENLQSLQSIAKVSQEKLEDENGLGKRGVQIVESSIQSSMKSLQSDLVSNAESAVKSWINTLVPKMEELLKRDRLSVEEAVLHGQETNAKKLKDTLVEAMTSTFSKLGEQNTEMEIRRAEKIVTQVKELRRELRKLVVDFDGKNTEIHKSQLNIEVDQGTIAQGIKDINAFLKLLKEFGLMQFQSGGHGQAHIAAIGQGQGQFRDSPQHHPDTTNAELKRLREERQSLFEERTKLDMEKQLLTDKRLHLEREKAEFDRERNRIREMESESKARIQEAQDLKQEAEKLKRKTVRIQDEAESKLRQLSNDKGKLKERIFEVEQLLSMKEQKVFLEKGDLLREKEFLEKIREQSLCPGCLKSLVPQLQSHSHSPPPPFHQIQGFPSFQDFGVSSISRILTPDEKAFFLQNKGTNL